MAISSGFRKNYSNSPKLFALSSVKIDSSLESLLGRIEEMGGISVGSATDCHGNKDFYYLLDGNSVRIEQRRGDKISFLVEVVSESEENLNKLKYELIYYIHSPE